LLGNGNGAWPQFKKKLADMILDFYGRQAGVDAYGLGSVAASEKV
jgi:hypothetical protein